MGLSQYIIGVYWVHAWGYQGTFMGFVPIYILQIHKKPQIGTFIGFRTIINPFIRYINGVVSLYRFTGRMGIK